MPKHRNNRRRAREIKKRLKNDNLRPRGNVTDGDEHEWQNEDYMKWVNEECHFCGEPDLPNYVSRLDETKRFNPKNMVSECPECRKLRGNLTLLEFKQAIEDGTIPS